MAPSTYRWPSYLWGSLLGSAVLMAGCTGGNPSAPAPDGEAIAHPTESPVASNDTPPTASTAGASEVPEAAVKAASRAPLPRSGEINIEGMPESIPLTPYRPEGVPVELSIPTEGVTTKESQGLRWTEVRLMASYEGEVNDEVYMAVVWPRAKTSLNQALEMAIGDRGWTQQQGLNLSDSRSAEANPSETVYSWERRRWRFTKNERTPDWSMGMVLLGELDGQGFWVVTHYPVEFLEGYGPRMELALKTLRSQ